MATSNRKKPTTHTSRAKAPGTTSARGRQGANVSEPAGVEDSNSGSKRLFDLRWLIAGMFVVYGVVLIITGIVDSQAQIAKASGVRINLWTGIGMLVVGIVFAVWARWRPLRAE